MLRCLACGRYLLSMRALRLHQDRAHVKFGGVDIDRVHYLYGAKRSQAVAAYLKKFG